MIYMEFIADLLWEKSFTWNLQILHSLQQENEDNKGCKMAFKKNVQQRIVQTWGNLCGFIQQNVTIY